MPPSLLPHKPNLRPIADADRRKVRHRLAVVLRVHRLARLAHRRQQLEVVDVVRRRERVEEFRFFLGCTKSVVSEGGGARGWAKVCGRERGGGRDSTGSVGREREMGEQSQRASPTPDTYIKRILERMWRARRDGHVVPRFSVNVGAVFGVEAERALGHEEGLVVLVVI